MEVQDHSYLRKLRNPPNCGTTTPFCWKPTAKRHHWTLIRLEHDFPWMPILPMRSVVSGRVCETDSEHWDLELGKSIQFGVKFWVCSPVKTNVAGWKINIFLIGDRSSNGCWFIVTLVFQAANSRCTFDQKVKPWEFFVAWHVTLGNCWPLLAKSVELRLGGKLWESHWNFPKIHSTKKP